VREHRPAGTNARVRLDRAVRDHRAEVEPLLTCLEAVQLGDVAQGQERPGRRQEAGVEEDADERAAGHDDRVLAVLRAERERLVERGGGEPDRLRHGPPSPCR
jgi:hypothetical protein